jgi:hypothetical protein
MATRQIDGYRVIVIPAAFLSRNPAGFRKFPQKHHDPVTSIAKSNTSRPQRDPKLDSGSKTPPE